MSPILKEENVLFSITFHNVSGAFSHCFVPQSETMAFMLNSEQWQLFLNFPPEKKLTAIHWSVETIIQGSSETYSKPLCVDSNATRASFLWNERTIFAFNVLAEGHISTF